MDKMKILAVVLGLLGFYNVSQGGGILSWLMLGAGVYMFVTGDYKFVQVRQKASELLATKQQKDNDRDLSNL